MHLRTKRIGGELHQNLIMDAAGVKKKGKLDCLVGGIAGRWIDGWTMLQAEKLLTVDLYLLLTGGMMLVVAILDMKQGVIANGL